MMNYFFLIIILLPHYIISHTDIENQLVDSNKIKRSIFSADKQAKWLNSIDCRANGTAVQMIHIKTPFILILNSTKGPIHHQAIQFDINCNNGSQTQFTIDLNSKGNSRRFGYYASKTILNATKLNFTVLEILNILNTACKHGIIDIDYHLVFNNCKRFARICYNMFNMLNQIEAKAHWRELMAKYTEEFEKCYCDNPNRNNSSNNYGWHIIGIKIVVIIIVVTIIGSIIYLCIRYQQ
jgi:hypothetical protein